MGKDRLKRILIFILIIGFLLIGGKVYADWLNKNKMAGTSVSLPTQQIGQKISDFGENVLGKAVEVLPGGNNLKKKLITTSTPTPLPSQNYSQPVTQNKEVEIKTQNIIQIIKELPAAEFENIKKQVFKDFCQEILKE